MKENLLFYHSLIKLIEDTRSRHVGVIGDLILDDYIEGDIERLSPEAPVQVVNVGHEYQKLGGGANVAHGLSALGAKVSLFGVVGTDEAARILLDLCARKGIETHGVMAMDDRSTTRKLRVMSRHQQMIRLDWEKIQPIDRSIEDKFLADLFQDAPPQAIVLSDYAKGVLTTSLIQKIITRAREAAIPVVVDPKSQNFDRYRGATILTPNLKEFQAAVQHTIDPKNDVELAKFAGELCEKYSFDALLVTLGELGMALWTPENGLYRVSATAREVYDVTGAGDTVAAILALALASQINFCHAAMIANTAGGIVIGKAGTSTVTPEELVARLSPKIENKLLDDASLEEHVKWWRLQGKRVVFTNGCFDLLHVGHLHILQQAAVHGDILAVGLNTDASIRRLKGEDRPLIPEQERACLLAAFDCVDAVILFSEDTPHNLIRKIKPDVLVKGSDYRMDQVVGREEVEAFGGRVVLVDFLPDKSSSMLINRIRGSLDNNQ
jgi:D-beta-D-heptose 7-phosphate kinase / D-beta-D-heptose 1-phosphate adenosyltransferase